MEKTRRETLNEIYSPLCERMRALSAALAERGLPGGERMVQRPLQ